jgi:hypothetical protein
MKITWARVGEQGSVADQARSWFWLQGEVVSLLQLCEWALGVGIERQKEEQHPSS